MHITQFFPPEMQKKCLFVSFKGSKPYFLASPLCTPPEAVGLDMLPVQRGAGLFLSQVRRGLYCLSLVRGPSSI